MISRIDIMPVMVRPMAHDDLATISDIERRSYDFPWSHGVFRDCLLAGYGCIVLERGNAVVGYGILSIAAGEAHILNLCVDPSFRSLGYGARLLDELLARARQAAVKQVFLEVRPSNVNAISLYRKRDFHRIAKRPAYYQARDGREDAEVFSLKLDDSQ
ncbi:MAG: ribosomal protein S18-alanine N-acetyltransferase [Woeseia sp.]